MTETGVITKLSRLSVADTVAKFTAMISTKGIKLFAVIDQAAEARQAGLMLRQANTDAINRASRYSYGEATGITQTVRNYGASLGFAVAQAERENQRPG